MLCSLSVNEWVWMSGGMIRTVEPWNTGRKIFYTVCGRWMNVYGAVVVWYCLSKSEVLGEKYYRVWFFDELITVTAPTSAFSRDLQACDCYKFAQFQEFIVVIDFIFLAIKKNAFQSTFYEFNQYLNISWKIWSDCCYCMMCPRYPGKLKTRSISCPWIFPHWKFTNKNNDVIFCSSTFQAGYCIWHIWIAIVLNLTGLKCEKVVL